MSAVWLARAETLQDNRAMLMQRAAGFLLSCGLVAGAVVAARGGCAQAGKGDAGNAALSTLAPIMATDGTNDPERPKAACKGPQAGRSSKTKPTP